MVATAPETHACPPKRSRDGRGAAVPETAVAAFTFSATAVTLQVHNGATRDGILSTKYTDDETDLVYYGYRYYSPEMGRWISRDPIGEDGGANLLSFALNAAVFLIDASGLQPENKLEMKPIKFYTDFQDFSWASGVLADSKQGWFGWTKGTIKSPMGQCRPCHRKEPSKKTEGKTVRKRCYESHLVKPMIVTVRTGILLNGRDTWPGGNNGLTQEAIAGVVDVERRWRGYFAEWFRVNDSVVFTALNTGCAWLKVDDCNNYRRCVQTAVQKDFKKLDTEIKKLDKKHGFSVAAYIDGLNGPRVPQTDDRPPYRPFDDTPEDLMTSLQDAIDACKTKYPPDFPAGAAPPQPESEK